MRRGWRGARALTTFAALLACVGGAGCSDEGDTAGAVTEIPVLLSIPVEDILAPRAIALTEKFTHTLSNVTSVALAPNGELYIADTDSSVVFVFDSTGKVARKIGRLSAGTGGFQANIPLHIALIPDTLYVIEGRLHAYSLAGEPLKTVRGGYRAATLALAPAGDVLLLATPVEAVITETSPTLAIDSVLIQRFDRARNTFDFTTFFLERAANYRSGRMSFRPILTNHPEFAISNNGSVFYTRGIDYAIEVINSIGEQVGVIKGEVPRLPVTPQEAEAARARLLEFAAQVQRDQPDVWQGVTESARATPVAEFKAQIGRIVAGADSLILVERLETDLSVDVQTAPSKWDLIHLGSGMIGQLALPVGVKPLALAAGTLIAVGASAAPGDGQPSRSNGMVYWYSFERTIP